MDLILQHYIIDMSSNNNFVQIPTMQGDGNGVRYVELELIQNGQQYIIDPTDVIATICGSKPDTTSIFNPCEITSEGYINVEITQQMSAVSGLGSYQITLMSKSKNSALSSFPFHTITTASPFDAKDVVSTNEFQQLVETLAKAEVSNNSAKEYADSAKNSATDANNAKENAEGFADDASEYSLLAKSYAVGTDNEVREDDKTDNAKYYKKLAEEARDKAKEYSDSAYETVVNAANNVTLNISNQLKIAESYVHGEVLDDTGNPIRENQDSDNGKYYYLQSKSYAVGNSGIRVEENSDNSKYYYLQSKSYAIGTGDTFRVGDKTDNAKYYYDEITKLITSISNAFIPMGTITFDELTTLSESAKQVGYMYNISDSFVSDSTFKDGGGYTYNIGTNVYYTSDGYWDCLSGIVEEIISATEPILQPNGMFWLQSY